MHYLIRRIGPKKQGARHHPRRSYVIVDTSENIVARASSYDEAREKLRELFNKVPNTLNSSIALDEVKQMVIQQIQTQTEPLSEEQLASLRKLNIPTHYYNHLLGTEPATAKLNLHVEKL